MTRLKLRSPRCLLPFLLSTEQIVSQIRTSEGFLQGKLMATFNLSMWTMTLWTSKEASKAFYLSDAHRVVMGKLSAWSSEAVVGHITVESCQLITWSDARTELCKIGKFAKLKEPSLDHKNGKIQSPKFILINRVLTPIVQ